MRHVLAVVLVMIPLLGWGQMELWPYCTTSKEGINLSFSTTSNSKNIYPSYHNHWSSFLDSSFSPSPLYLVVSRPLFRQTIQPLVEWKRMQGFEVVELYADTNDCDIIRDSIKNLYDHASSTHPAPTYVLLVGDVGHIGAFKGRHKPSSEFSSYYTDLYYGEYTDDYFPEAMVGRLSAADTHQLSLLVDKTLKYEQMTFADKSYLAKALFVAGAESRWPAPTTTNGQTHYVSQRVKAFDRSIDTCCYYNPGSSDSLEAIADVVRQGAGLVCYTAHGTVDGWSNPYFTSPIADTLSDSLPSIYINNCCLSNSFNADCFGEHLLRKELGGAVGVIGATNSSLWNEDYFWTVGPLYPFENNPTYNPEKLGAFDRLLHIGEEPFGQQVLTLGQMLHAGSYAVTQLGTPCDAYYWEIYNLLGDPSLMPFIGTPQPTLMLLPDSIECGSTQIPLSGTPFSYVAASQDNRLIGVAMTDGVGRATLSLSEPITTDRVVLVSTCQFHIPRIDTLFSQTPPEGCLAVMRHSLSSSFDTLTLVIRNIGDNPCVGHKIKVWQTEDDTASGARLSSIHTSTLRMLLPLEYDTVILPLKITTGQRPLLSLHLDMIDSTHSYSSLPIHFDVDLPCARLVSLQLRQDDIPIQHLYPGGRYTAVAIFENVGQDTALVSICQEICQPIALAPHHEDTLFLELGIDDTSSHLILKTHVQCGPWKTTNLHCFIVGNPFEDFESGGLRLYPWDTNTTVSSWLSDSSVYHSGRFSARSGSIGHRQRSDLALAVNLPLDDTIAFWLRTSCEEEYDKLSFFIDGQVQQTFSGSLAWRRVCYPIPQGRHQLLWRYSKDDNGSQGSDCVWIDDISLPFIDWDSRCGHGDTSTLSIPTPPPSQHFVLFPNPAHHQFYIHPVPPEHCTITISDIYGRTMDTFRSTQEPYNIQLTPGIYIVTISTAHQTSSHKILIQ